MKRIVMVVVIGTHSVHPDVRCRLGTKHSHDQRIREGYDRRGSARR